MSNAQKVFYSAKTQKVSHYTVDWYRNGFCYRTTVGVPKYKIPEYKEMAKSLGETIKITKE